MLKTILPDENRRPGFLYFSLIFLICGFGLYIAFKDWNSGTLIPLFKTIHYPSVFLSIVCAVGAVWIRALRWRLILYPLGETRVWQLFASTMIGYFGNGFLPFRLGEVLKCVAAKKLVKKISLSSIFGTVIVERSLDLIGLSGVALLVLATNSVSTWLVSAIVVLVTLSFGLLIVLMLTDRFQDLLTDFLKRTGAHFFGRKAERPLENIVNFLRGLELAKNSDNLVPIVGYTALYWALQWGILHSVAFALHMEISLGQTGVVLLATMLATSIPSVPSNIGIFHAAAVLALTTILHIPSEVAIAYAIISHFTRVVFIIALGAVLSTFVFANFGSSTSS